MRRLVSIGIVLFSGLLWAGCDLYSERDASSHLSARIAIELGSFHQAQVEGQLVGCATSMELAVLRVNEREMTAEVDSDTILFDVSGVSQGEVRFEAMIVSNTGETLFAGSQVQSINVEDFGMIDIGLNKLRPVLQVCPDTVLLHPENNFLEFVIVANRDPRPTFSMADTLSWRVRLPDQCFFDTGALRCPLVEPRMETIVGPRGMFVRISSSREVPFTVSTVRFESDAGFAEVHVMQDTSLFQ